MPNIKSSKKSVKQDIKTTEANNVYTAKVKNSIKKVVVYSPRLACPIPNPHISRLDLSVSTGITSLASPISQFRIVYLVTNPIRTPKFILSSFGHPGPEQPNPRAGVPIIRSKG